MSIKNAFLAQAETQGKKDIFTRPTPKKPPKPKTFEEIKGSYIISVPGIPPDVSLENVRDWMHMNDTKESIFRNRQLAIF